MTAVAPVLAAPEPSDATLALSRAYGHLVAADQHAATMTPAEHLVAANAWTAYALALSTNDMMAAVDE